MHLYDGVRDAFVTLNIGKCSVSRNELTGFRDGGLRIRTAATEGLNN